MTIGPLTEESIGHVMDNLWKAGRQEIRTLGLSMDEVRAEFTRLIGEPFTAAFYDDDGACCAIAALLPIGIGRWRSRFLATEGGFKRIWFQLTHFLGRFSNDLVHRANDGKGYIEILSASGSPRVAHWFRAMEFTYDGKDGQIRRYVKTGR